MAIQEPVIPGITNGVIWAPIQKELSWLQRHERIVIVALVLVAGVFLGNKLLNYESAQKDAKVAALTLVVNQDKQTVANLALQASTAQAAYQTTLDAITKENQALASANAQELASLAQRQTADRALPLPAVASRIEVLVPGAQGGITATTAGVVMNDTASHSVLTTLEEVPVLQDELKNETQVAVNTKSALDAASTVISDKTAQVAGLNKSLTDQQAHEAAAVAAEKLKTKKAWRSGFKWGFATGFAAGAFIMHGVGL
jgi:hypothetical protein